MMVTMCCGHSFFLLFLVVVSVVVVVRVVIRSCCSLAVPQHTRTALVVCCCLLLLVLSGCLMVRHTAATIIVRIRTETKREKNDTNQSRSKKAITCFWRVGVDNQQQQTSETTCDVVGFGKNLTCDLMVHRTGMLVVMLSLSVCC